MPPAARPPPRSPAAPTLSRGAQALLPAPLPASSTSKTDRRVVPRSLRATLLSGLVVGLIQAGVATTRPPAPALLAQALGAPALAQAALPMALASGLAAGALNAVSALALVRGALNLLGRTDHVSYALCGAALAFLYASATLALGLTTLDPGVTREIALGGTAAFLYRLFAGARLRPAA